VLRKIILKIKSLRLPAACLPAKAGQRQVFVI
jgi:hypothetical protein